jgi:hypothetical protein
VVVTTTPSKVSTVRFQILATFAKVMAKGKYVVLRFSEEVALNTKAIVGDGKRYNTGGA